MPFSPHHLPRPANDAPVNDGTTVSDLEVRGTVPMGLSGLYVRIGDGMVDAVTLTQGRAPSYRNPSIPTRATNVIAFGNSIFAFGERSLAYELDASVDTIRRVDLAGRRRSLTSTPKVDPITGELHLLTFSSDPSQLHVTLAPGLLTRTIRPIENAPSHIRQLEVTCDHVVLLADGFVGLTDRSGPSTRASWFPIDTDTRHVAMAHEHGEAVVVYATGPSLERWTLRRRAKTAHSQVLDATPHTFASSNNLLQNTAHRFLWTVGSGVLHKHDLFAGTRQSHDFGGGRHPIQHLFVADPERSHTEDGGWIVGFVHDPTRHETDFVVLDAHAIERPATAVARVPRRIPNGRDR